MSGAGRLVYRGLTALQLPKLRRAVSRRATVFTFHGVVANAHVGRGERSLHIGETAFARYVEWISANYAVVPLGELVDRARRGGPLRGLAALTFDDAYVGVFRHAVPVLRRFALPATVFAIEGASARPAPLWWDVLGDADELTDALRARCLDAWRGEDARITAALGARPEVDLPETMLPAPWSVIVDHAGSDLAIEAHTDTHPNLAALSGDEVSRELTASRGGIASRLGEAPRILAYPYGRVSSLVVERAAEAGFTAGVTMVATTVPPRVDPFRIPRINVPAGISLPALDCWSVGLRPPRRTS